MAGFELIALFVLLLLVSAYFSAIETAVFSSNRLRIRHLAQKSNWRARTVAQFQEQPERFLGVVLVGNNVVNIVLASVSSAFFVVQYGERGIWISSAIVTFLVLLFSEVLPKTLAAYKPERIALFFAPVTAVTYRIIHPFVRYLTALVALILRTLGFSERERHHVTEEEFKTLFAVAQDEGLLNKEKALLYNNIWELTAVTAREIMVPKSQVTSIGAEATLRECLDVIKEHKYSRLPVHDGSLDNVIGIIHTKDVMDFWGQEDLFSVRRILRTVRFVPDVVGVYTVFELLKKEHIHMGCVVDEYGNFEGIVTMEDILEEIVGEIRDEYDFDEGALVRPIDQDTFLVDGSTPIREINKALGTSVDEAETTVAGLFFLKLGRMPQKDEKLDIDGLTFKVKNVKGSRIRRVVIRRGEGA